MTPPFNCGTPDCPGKTWSWYCDACIERKHAQERQGG